MITRTKILELAREHLEVLIADDDELNSPTDFAATREQLIAFAKRVAAIARAEGFNEGYEMGSTGPFGEPLK